MQSQPNQGVQRGKEPKRNLGLTLANDVCRTYIRTIAAIIEISCFIYTFLFLLLLGFKDIIQIEAVKTCDQRYQLRLHHNWLP